jgi:hypothetical protein
MGRKMDEICFWQRGTCNVVGSLPLLVMLTVSNGCLQFNNVGIYTKENSGWLSTDLCILDLSSSFSDLQSDPAKGKLSNDVRKILLPKNDKLFLD